MKKLNKIMAGIMAVSLCMAGSAELFQNGFISGISMTASAEGSGTCGENVNWVFDDSGTLTISGTGDMNGSFATMWSCSKSAVKVIIEEGVTSIGSSAFKEFKHLTSVTIPDSVTSIDSRAFSYCTSLTSVTIPDSVTSIGSGAFMECKSLTSVTIPDSVTSIDYWAFTNCTSLTSVTIPDSITSIGERTFEGCTGLTSVKLPENLTSIGDIAFRYCTSLTSIIIPDSVTSIGEYAFYETGLTSVTIPESVTSIGNSAFGYSAYSSFAYGYSSKLTEITILNPECKIYDDYSTISETTTIYGYENSTAQAYAEKYKRTFVAIEEPPVIEFESGDINGDNLIDSVDATAVSIEYAHLATGVESTLSDEQKKAADVNGDGFIDAVDSTYILRYYAKISAGQNIDFAEFVKNN